MALTQKQREEALSLIRQYQSPTKTSDESDRMKRLRSVVEGQTEQVEPEKKGFLEQFRSEVKNTTEKEKLESFSKGIFKGALSTVRGAAGLGEKMLTGIAKALLPKSAEKALGISEPIKKTGAEKLIKEEWVTPENAFEKLGKGAEQIGEFFIPGTASFKVGKAVKGATALAKTPRLATTMGVLTTGAGEAMLTGGQTALQKGKIDNETKIATMMGFTVPVAGGVLKESIKGIGRLSAAFLGKTTGTSPTIIKAAFNNPNVIKYARAAGKDADAMQEEVLETAQLGMKELVKRRASEYSAKLTKIKTNKTQLDDIVRGVRKEAVSLMDEFDVRVVKQTDKLGKKLNTPDWAESTLLEGQNVAERALNDVMGWTDNTARGLDKLKRRLGTYIDQVSAPGKKQAKLFVTRLKQEVTKGLEKNVKGYGEMTAGYKKASSMIDEIADALSLKDKAKKETTLRKLMQSLNENKETRQELLEILERATGEDISGKVAGTQLTELMPKGLLGKLVPGASIAGAIISPASIPYLFLSGMFTSPRLVAELVTILGMVDRQMIKAGEFSPQIQRLLREVYLKIREENKKTDTKKIPATSGMSIPSLPLK